MAWEYIGALTTTSGVKILSKPDTFAHGDSTTNRELFFSRLFSIGVDERATLSGWTQSYHRWFTLINNNYIEAKFDGNNLLSVRLFFANGTLITSGNMSMDLSLEHWSLAISINTEMGIADLGTCMYVYNGKYGFWGGGFNNNSLIFQWLTGSWYPSNPMNYKPLYNLHSNNQIFTLTTIGKTPNDGSEVVLAPAEDIISWSEQSRLKDYIINLRESGRWVKMFTLNEHKYIGLRVDTYTQDGSLGYWNCTIGFYIDGVRQESLNLNILSNTITDINNSWGFYLAISVDSENEACLPTIVYKDVTTGNVSYQREGYGDPEGLYEYLLPFFGATIDPENPDIPLVDPTPTTDGEYGGGGTWSSPDFPVLVPDLPSVGVSECGFMSLYKMTTTQLNALASYLWSDDFLDEVKKFFSDPMQMIISCKMLPYNVSASSTTETIQAGNVSTTCTGYKIYGNNQYTKIDCGEILLPERTKTYLDYSPYCSAQIFLPFIGMRPIDVDTCVGHKIGVKYNCDCLTGQSVCFVTIDGNVAYTYECNIGMDIPISSESYQGIMGALTSALNVPLSVGTAIATGGMSVPLSGASLVSSAVGMANGSRPTIERSGSVSGVGGFLNHRQPFLILEYTDPVQAKNQKHFMGAPTNKNVVLKTCKGLTTVEQIYLNVLEATEEEKTEILDLLKGGVLI